MSRKSYSFPENLSDKFSSCSIDGKKTSTGRKPPRTRSVVISENTLERPSSSREIIITENNVNKPSDDSEVESQSGTSDGQNSLKSYPSEKNIIIEEKTPITSEPEQPLDPLPVETSPDVKEKNDKEDNNNNNSLGVSGRRKRRNAPKTPPPTNNDVTEFSPDQEKPAYNVIATARSKLQSKPDGYTSRRQRALLGKDCEEEWEKYTHLPGMKVIPVGTPEWKVELLQKKNRQYIQEYLREKSAQQKAKMEEKSKQEEARREEEKWRGVPDWMKPIMKEKERKRQQERRQRLAAATALRPRVELFEKMQKEKKEQESFKTLPQWRQELILRKKEKTVLEGMPEWQKDLVLKKKVGSGKKTFESS